VRRALIAAVLLGAAPAAAAEAWQNGISGVGRISLLGGWKLTPNDHFFKQSADLGYPTVSRGIGGGQGTASFGYGAVSFLEVSIDLFLGNDRFQIDTFNPINVLTYGALIGVRFTFMDLLFPGFAPYVGVGVGPTLGYVWTGTEGETFERLVTAVAGTAGLTYRVNDRFGLTLEYRFLYARGVWVTSGVNIGGSFFSLGAVIYFPRTVPDSSRMLGGS
jgi:opacity protein-like surface antigen